MQLTRKQEEAVRIAVARYKAKEPYTVLSGYAGVGKSTTIQFIITALGLYPEDVGYMAYTGKAAQVLRQKGCPNAMTAHRMLYKSYPRRDGTFYHKPKEIGSLADYKLIVVDEVSMLPQSMWELLLKHRIPIIACGDPFQLPALFEGTNILDTSDIFLDEVMRQAAENEIIRVATDVRNFKLPQIGTGTEVNVIRKQELNSGMLAWADQILCGKNVTRQGLNRFYRKEIGINSEEPVLGDKIICLRNNWEIANRLGEALVNGTIGTITGMKMRSNPFFSKELVLTFIPEYLDEKFSEDLQMFEEIPADYQLLTTGEPTINRKNFSKIPKIFHPNEFDYGYVITVWKSQGSSYPKVLFFAEEVGKMDREQYFKYLYTGITRAEKKLTLVLPV